jgi:hypothetical protein
MLVGMSGCCEFLSDCTQSVQREISLPIAIAWLPSRPCSSEFEDGQLRQQSNLKLSQAYHAFGDDKHYEPLRQSHERLWLVEESLSVRKLRGVCASFPFLSTCMKLHQHQPRLVGPVANKGQASVRNTNNPSLGRMVIMRNSDQARKVVRLLNGEARDRCKLGITPHQDRVTVP